MVGDTEAISSISVRLESRALLLGSSVLTAAEFQRSRRKFRQDEKPCGAGAYMKEEKSSLDGSEFAYF